MSRWIERTLMVLWVLGAMTVGGEGQAQEQSSYEGYRKAIEKLVCTTPQEQTELIPLTKETIRRHIDIYYNDRCTQKPELPDGIVRTTTSGGPRD